MRKFLKVLRICIILTTVSCSLLSCSNQKEDDFKIIYNKIDTLQTERFSMSVKVKYDNKSTLIEIKRQYKDSVDVEYLELFREEDGYYIKSNNIVYDEFEILNNKLFLSLNESYDYKIGVSALDSVKYDSYSYEIKEGLYGRIVTMYPIPSFYCKIIYDDTFRIKAIVFKGGYLNYRIESQDYDGIDRMMNENGILKYPIVDEVKKDSIKFMSTIDNWWTEL